MKVSEVVGIYSLCSTSHNGFVRGGLNGGGVRVRIITSDVSREILETKVQP